jgi:hypothetical protein
MKKFEPGEEVTLLKKVVSWFLVDTNAQKAVTLDMPKYGNIYTVEAYTRYTDGRGWFITLREVKSETVDYIELPERLFESVMSDNELYSQIDDYL